ncbi:MAG: bifunctional proline dehydrogenase/L-glutamate gamma-semialdehyde dehydrogenase PutA, partial [Gammaproteobacteria bacterium]|nr:bifunctional proline dehydrogenase/L-glutamate gamma-semialdehyde dehydrogenase PutA [Gammaproteobacteria bacterium]
MRHFAFKAPTLSEDISRNYHCDETELVKKLIQEASLNADAVFRIKSRAYNLVEEVRRARMNRGGLDAFMMEYDLSCDEGIALMCLAEALLRIPDSDTVDALIQDKISKGDWEQHLGQSGSMFVNAATWSLMLTGKLVSPEQSQNRFKEVLRKFFSQQSEGIIRKSVSQAMKILGRQFVMGETIDEALNRAKKQERIGYRYSYDMLGEAARTDADALYYFKQYENAIHKIGQAAAGAGPIKSPGISIKLSALLSRYEVGQYEQAHQALYNRTKALALLAKKYDLNLTIDAEEANRLELSLTLLERLALDPELDGWQGLGLAVQAYQKRALPVLKWLKALAEKSHRRLMVRLVKGAYWDSEIKYAQTQGLPDYPVFTRKVYTDVSYQACAKFMLAHPQAFYCQFATHNAYTLSMVLELIGDSKTDFEFQCLHGMGDTLYDQVVGTEKMGLPCRVYAPVGTHQHLLAYLVRRLLENGANSSFVNRIINAEVPIEDLLQDPIQIAEKLGGARHSKIPTPRHIYGTRLNSKGMELAHFAVLKTLNAALEPLWDKKYAAVPLIAVNIKNDTPAQEVHNPADHSDVVGHLTQSTPEQAKAALEAAGKAFPRWNKTSAKDRAECLRRAADLLEERMPEFMMLAVREAGKTWSNAIAEVREAIDFCRYYADMAEHYFSEPTRLPGPTGELNLLYLSGKGPMVCISPWNFPLAIFLGQVTAALAAGNPVLAK